MKLKSPETPKCFSRRKVIFYSFLGLIVIVALLLSSAFRSLDRINAYEFYQKEYSSMLYRYKRESFGGYKLLLLESTFGAVKSAISNLLSDTTRDRLNINISFEHFKLLEQQRSEALETDEVYLIADRSYVPATVQHKNKKILVRLRLKGEHVDHLIHPRKWSFRVKTRGNDRLFGMKSFSIQSPHVRTFQHEPLFHKVLRDVGVMAVRYQFVDVAINGEPIGLMAVEEHFGKELIESEQRRESVILKLNDEHVIESYLAMKKHPLYEKVIAQVKGKDRQFYLKNANLHLNGPFAGVGTMYYNARNRPIEVFQANRISKSTNLSHYREVAIGLLRGAIHGEIPPGEVFDTEKYGAFFSGLWFWTTFHGAQFSNQRFYFNPITYNFEPISYDSEAYMTIDTRPMAFDPNRFDTQITRLIFSSSETLESFENYAERLFDMVFKDDYLEDLQKLERSLLHDLRSEYRSLPPIHFPYIKNHMVRTIANIREGQYFTRAEPIDIKVNILPDLELPAVVHAYLVKKDQGVVLQLANILPYETVILEIDVRKSNSNRKLSAEGGSLLPISLPPTLQGQAPELVSITLHGETEIDGLTVTGRARTSKQDRIYQFNAVPYAPMLKSHPLSPQSLGEIVLKAPFLDYSAEETALVVTPGTWIVNEMIIPPIGVGVIIEAGTTLRFAEKAGFTLRGRTEFRGLADKKIILEPLSKHWSGIAVIKARGKSKWEHTQVRDITNTSKGQWFVTGGVTFYESNVSFTNVSINGSTAEDALNIIRSEFSLDRVRIEDTASDAFDGDFVTGSIDNSVFRSIGGDAIDVSGSEITVTRSAISSIADKALSIGERSSAIIKNVEVRDSAIGIASKDSSAVRVDDSVFSEISYATLIAYRKKPEFAGASIVANNISYPQSETGIVAQNKSVIVVNGAAVEPHKLKVEELYER